MHRVDTNGNVANHFDEGDPGVPRLPTQIDAAILNAFQEELANAIEGMGVTLVKGTNNQLATIIADFVTKTTAQTITGIKTFHQATNARNVIVQSDASAYPVVGVTQGGTGPGVQSDVTGDGRAVYANAAHGEAVAGYGGVDAGVPAVYGKCQSDGATSAGVRGKSNGPSNAGQSYGVLGEVTAGTPTGWTGAGVKGDGSAASVYGVIAQGDTTTPVKAAFRVVPQDTAPSAPAEGDIYFNSTTHLAYRFDGSSWVDFTTAYRCRTVANAGVLPGSAVVGDLCVAASTGKLYVFDGGSWVVVGTQT